MTDTCRTSRARRKSCCASPEALKLPTFLREHDKLARQCASDGVDHVRYLLRLAELELIERERRTVERRIKEAGFPAVKPRQLRLPGVAVAEQGVGAGPGPRGSMCSGGRT